MKRAFLVLKREYLEHVRRRSFIVSTIAGPMILLLLYAIPIMSMFFVPDEQLHVAVLDRVGGIADGFIASVDDTLRDGRPRYVMMEMHPDNGDFERQRRVMIEAIKAGGLDIVIDIPETVLQDGRVNFLAENVLNDQVTDYLAARLNPVIIARRFASEGIGSKEVEALTKRVRFNEQKVTKTGVLAEAEVAGEYIVSIVFVMLLYSMLLTWGMSVQRSIIEEKSSRVIEVMLSSVEPRDLFIGKILGVGAVGFTQLLIWSTLLLSLALSSGLMAAQVAGFIQVGLSDVIYLMVYFVLGFFLYSSIFTIVGAMCTTEQDAQQLQSLVILPLIVPIMFVFLVMQNPSSTLAVVLSMVPLFTPMLMLARVSIIEPPVWQIVASIVILLLSIWGIVWVSAKIFRVGILMYGKRPSFKEVWRWSRYA